MTHEHKAHGEADHGPEHDQGLPNAWEISGDLGAAESLADVITEDL